MRIVRVGVILGGNFSRWKFSGCELSGGNHPGGNFLGGSFPSTFTYILNGWPISQPKDK